MTVAAWILLAAAAGAAVVDWVAVARGARRVEGVAKPAVMVLLGAVVAVLEGPSATERAWLMAAVAAGAVGDVCLWTKRDPLFLAGLGAFLAGHVAYVVALGASGVQSGALAVGAVLVAVAAAGVGTVIVRGAWRRAGPALGVPVAAYVGVISVMVVVAVGTTRPLAVAGALLFFASDGLIGINRFVRPLAWSPVPIMVTYHLGQAGLILSFAT